MTHKQTARGKDEFFYPSCEKPHQIHAVRWTPDDDTPIRGVLQIVHGLAEHVERYEDFARFCNQHGFVVVGNDHLGHGKTAKSQKELGCFPHQNGWQKVTRDVRSLRVLAGNQYPELPYFLLGHSMGSFLTRTYLIPYPGTIDGAIVVGTGQEPRALLRDVETLAATISKTHGRDRESKLVQTLCFGTYNKQFRPTRTSSDWLCRDEAVVDAFIADPLCGFPPSPGMFWELMAGCLLIGNPKQLKQMDTRTPVCFLSGSRDPVGQNSKGVQKVYRMFEEAGCTDLSIKLYPDARHEVLNEYNKSEVYHDVLSFIEQHL